MPHASTVRTIPAIITSTNTSWSTEHCASMLQALAKKGVCLTGLGLSSDGFLACDTKGRVWRFGQWDHEDEVAHRDTPRKLLGARRPSPRTWHPSVPIADLACGASHAVLLGAKGEVYTWGTSLTGALGLGDTVASAALPSRLPLRRASAVAATQDSTAVLVGGALFMAGQCVPSASAPPVHSISPVPGLHGCTVVRLSAGANHLVCCTAKGSAVVVGDNSRGQLGLGHVGGFASTPLLVSLPAPDTPELPPPQVTHVAAGAHHTVFVDTRRRLWMAGAAEALGATEDAGLPVLALSLGHLDNSAAGSVAVRRVVAGRTSTAVLLSDDSFLVACLEEAADMLHPLPAHADPRRFNELPLVHTHCDVAAAPGIRTTATVKGSSVLAAHSPAGSVTCVPVRFHNDCPLPAPAPGPDQGTAAELFASAVRMVLRGSALTRAAYASLFYASAPLPSQDQHAALADAALVQALGLAHARLRQAPPEEEWAHLPPETRRDMLALPAALEEGMRHDQRRRLRTALGFGPKALADDAPHIQDDVSLVSEWGSPTSPPRKV